MYASLLAVLQAHGGGVLYHKGVYYWYGENKAGPTYMSFTLGSVPDPVAFHTLALAIALNLY